MKFLQKIRDAPGPGFALAQSMLKIRNMQWWTGALLLTLMIFIVVFAYVARKPLCIDSKLVERIDSISETGTSTAFRCGLHKHVEYDANLANQAKDLSRRLQKLERYFEWLSPLKARVNLTVISGRGPYFRIRGHEIYMSESILKARGQLEKAFFRVWFQERASLELQSHTLIEESLTDFLYYTFAGDLNLQDPNSGLYLNQDQEARWPRVLSNFKGYCKSIWSSNDDQKLCEDLESFSHEEIPAQSLRPLISQTMIESYQILEPKEQVEFLKSLAPSLSQLDFHSKNFGMTSKEFPQQSYHEAISQLENWSYFLSEMKVQIPMAQKLSALFDLNLKRRGFDGSAPQSELDILIFTEGLKAGQKEKILAQVEKHPETLIGMESEKHIQMSFLAEPLNLSVLGPVKANTGILFHCGTLDLYRLNRLSKKVQKLLYVRACDNQDIKLSGFFEKGITSFAQQNPTLKFAQIHLPSLLMAASKMPGVNPFHLISANKKDSLKILGWKEPSYDEVLKAYKAQSAIEFVDWYRL